jgi:hypothetical protein
MWIVFHNTGSPEECVLDAEADFARLAALQAAILFLLETPPVGRG